jgi:hypothetical protein
MLAPCASWLVADGWHVVLPSRRYAPIPIVPDTVASGRALWVAADWSEPAGLAERAARTLGGQADLLVAWVHNEHRATVLNAVAPLLAPGAPVVEVHGAAATDPVTGCPEPVLADHPTQQVVLGFMPAGEVMRRLTYEEISDGVLEAVTRALAGNAPSVRQVGDPEPFHRRASAGRTSHVVHSGR